LHLDPPDEQLNDPRLLGIPVLDLHESALAAAGRGGRAIDFRPAARRLLGPSQPDTQGKLAPLLGVVWGRHRVVGLEPKSLAVLVGRKLVLHSEVALQQLVLLAEDQAHEVVWSDRPAHGHNWSQLFGTLGSDSVPSDANSIPTALITFGTSSTRIL
jgi:hypothetical protein